MCTYADSIERKAMDRGFKEGLEQALKALVYSLSKFEKDFDSLYEVVIRNDVYKDVTREEVMRYYNN